MGTRAYRLVVEQKACKINAEDFSLEGFQKIPFTRNGKMPKKH